MTIPLNSPSIDHLQHMCKCDIKKSELSPYIYDKYIRKVRNIYEFMWNGLHMALNATNGEFGPFGIANCIDFRKILPNGYTNYPRGHSYTCFSLCVQNVNPQMTIGEICSQFRGNFDLVKVNEQFYKDYMFPLEVNRDDWALSHFSNVGPLNIKSPYGAVAKLSDTFPVY